MSDEIEDLKARVAAARDRLASDVDFARKVELRLNDLARIVDGSLARQSAELDNARSRIGALENELERALARAEQAIGEAARAERLAKENGELRSMVMALLEVIEGRQKSSLASVMQKLEENVSALMVPAAEAPLSGGVENAPFSVAEAEPEPDATPESQEPVEEFDLGPEAPAEVELEAEPQPHGNEEAIELVPDEVAPAGTPPLEDLSEIALYDAADEVVEPRHS
jgi:hypothetical protein